MKIFRDVTEKARSYNENRVFSLENVDEQLYSLSRKYYMCKVEMQRLREYYVTMLEKRANQLGVRLHLFICVY